MWAKFSLCQHFSDSMIHPSLSTSDPFIYFIFNTHTVSLIIFFRLFVRRLSLSHTHTYSLLYSHSSCAHTNNVHLNECSLLWNSWRCIIVLFAFKLPTFSQLIVWFIFLFLLSFLLFSSLNHLIFHFLLFVCHHFSTDTFDLWNDWFERVSKLVSDGLGEWVNVCGDMLGNS